MLTGMVNITQQAFEGAAAKPEVPCSPNPVLPC